MTVAIAIIAALFVVLVASFSVMTVRIVPQARARNVERLGRYRKTLEPGMNVIIPLIDRVKPLIDLREQVVSFLGQPVITEDNLVVKIDTVLFFQVTDPRAADYEIVDYIQAIEQLTATMLRSVIGSMDLEQSLTSRDKINTMLRGVLDDASGKWGIRVTRVEIKAIDPPQSVKEAMEKQMRAEREKRAAILTAEGVRQSQILTADGDKQGTILRAEGDKQSAILRAEGQAAAISKVFQSIHEGDPDPKLLAYQYVQALPQIANGAGSSVWMIPNEVTSALRTFSSAFESATGDKPAVAGPGPAVLAAGLGSAVAGPDPAAVAGPTSAAGAGTSDTAVAGTSDAGGAGNSDAAAAVNSDAAGAGKSDAAAAGNSDAGGAGYSDAAGAGKSDAAAAGNSDAAGAGKLDAAGAAPGSAAQAAPDAETADSLGAATVAGLDRALVDGLSLAVDGQGLGFDAPGQPGNLALDEAGILIPGEPGNPAPGVLGNLAPEVPGTPLPPLRPQVPGQARPTDLEA